MMVIDLSRNEFFSFPVFFSFSDRSLVYSTKSYCMICISCYCLFCEATQEVYDPEMIFVVRFENGHNDH